MPTATAKLSRYFPSASEDTESTAILDFGIMYLYEVKWYYIEDDQLGGSITLERASERFRSLDPYHDPDL